MRILVVARTRDPHRQAEALRAALGLTLRGASVEVAHAGPLLSPLARRAADTLRSFGHAVAEVAEAEAEAEAGADADAGAETDAALAEALARADAVEVWT